MSEFDTKPTIETLLEEMRKGFAAMKVEFDQVHSEIRSLSKKFDELAHDLYNLRGRVAIIEDQVQPES